MPLARLVLLRLVAMVALPVSTLLTYDRLHPDRAFCPLARACEQAGSSLLGSMGGVPTSSLGMLAFAGLFLVTLLPLGIARRVLKPAGVVAASAGLIFVGYQALFLPAFCPLCLVADTAGLLAGALTFRWPAPNAKQARAWQESESDAARIAWTLAAILCIVTPFAWPREKEPGWVEIAPQTALLENVAPAPAPAPAAEHPEPKAPPPPTQPTPKASEPPTLAATTPPAVLDIVATQAPVPPPEPAAAPVPKVTPRAPAPVAAPPPPPAKPVVGIVEYLNAFCSHCRATHRRLGVVLSELDVTPRIRRIYTWSSGEAPLWARACAGAAEQGLEGRMFEELLVARSESPDEIFGAAVRAGVDVARLREAIRTDAGATRLADDRQLVQRAGLQGLPTLDIGRRRLLGEQSIPELREAVVTAIATPSR